MKTQKTILKICFLAMLLAAQGVTSVLAADGDNQGPHPGFPKVGGHLGLAVPLITMGSPTTDIGSDYVKLGLAPGITVKLGERWAIDFETVAYNDFKVGGTTSFVMDPGVIYDAGCASVGFRTAIQVGPTQNWGFIPIALRAFSLGGIKLFTEIDFPYFIQPSGGKLTIQPQIGIAF